MSVAELLKLVERLDHEHEIAPPAAMLSDASGHYDREVAQLVGARDKGILPALLARAGEAREVVSATPPHFPVDGGYGKLFGRVTVGEKARFALKLMLGEQMALEAIAAGPAWFRTHGATLRWDARQGRFVKG